MLYKPTQYAKLWDTWLFHHAGTYFVYYLIAEHSPGEGVGMAISSDGVHWYEVGMVLPKATDAQWLGSGAVWKSPAFERDGKFIMNFSEWRGPAMLEGQQTIFFAESTDLMHWTCCGDDCELKPDPRWYRVNEGELSRWDCIYAMPRAGGGLLGYWTANPKDTHPGIGFGESDDGVHWRCLPPPAIEWGATPRMFTMEAGAVERIGEKFYALFGAYHGHAGRLRGMFQFSADAPQGPFRPAAKNYALLATPERLPATYFARFFHAPDGLLVNHHSISRDDERAFAPLKRAVVDDAGTLRLHYWQGNDALRGDPIFISPVRQVDGERITMLDVDFDVKRGVVLEGSITNLPTRLREGGFAGVGFAIEQNANESTAVRIHTSSIADFGMIRRDGLYFRQDDLIDRETPATKHATFRLLLRHPFIELYVNDVLMQCYSLPQATTGRLGLLHGNAGTTFENLALHKMTL